MFTVLRFHSFLQTLHGKLNHGARVVFADNIFVTGSSTSISRVDKDGNTYQHRELADGQKFEVLKNFPDEATFRAAVEPFARSCEFRRFTYYWCGWYELR